MTTTDKDFEFLASLEKKIRQTPNIGLHQIFNLRVVRKSMLSLLRMQKKLEQIVKMSEIILEEEFGNDETSDELKQEVAISK